MQGLAGCDPSFTEVFIVPKSTRKLPYRIAVDFETIKPFVEQGRNREDVPPRKIIEKLGYSVSFISDYRNREEQWTVRTMCGAYAQAVRMFNYCNLSFPKQSDALNNLLQRRTATCLAQAMISASIQIGRSFKVVSSMTTFAKLQGFRRTPPSGFLSAGWPILRIAWVRCQTMCPSTRRLN